MAAENLSFNKCCRNAKNAVIYFSGHTGIAKYLLDMPGVNINEVNDDGNSILLSMMKEGSNNAIDLDFVSQIEELVGQQFPA